jgi:twitching motility protein PilT
MPKGQPIDAHIRLTHEPELNKYFKAAIKAKASDLHLKVGQVPRLRIYGTLKNTTGEQMTEQQMEKLVFEILSEAQKEFFLAEGAIDLAYDVSEEDRFRVNIFRQRGMISLSGRWITSNIPPFEALHLPPIVEKIAETHEGLVLVTGPTGCGKTTTIASMIDYVNRTRACHIITVEDPIEYLHRDQKAIVSQREIGIDVPDYEDALRSLMRQDPDVVVIGEMRDKDTIVAGMRAAETGHMVFGTMHSANAAQTVQRLLDLFPSQERDLARKTFALTCRAVISQELLPGLKRGVERIPAVEILIVNAIVRKLILEEREADLPSVIRACQHEGMQDFTASLCELVNKEYIDIKKAYEYAPNVEELKMAMKGIRSAASGIL